MCPAWAVGPVESSPRIAMSSSSLNVTWFLREVRSVVVRNLHHPQHSPQTANISSCPSLFISLKDPGSNSSSTLLYEGKSSDHTYNPSWTIVGLKLMPAALLLNDGKIENHMLHVEIVVNNGNNLVKYYSEEINPSNLVRLGKLDLNTINILPHNTLLLQTDDGYYVSDKLSQRLQLLNIIPKPLPDNTANDDEEEIEDTAMLINKYNTITSEVNRFKEEILVNINNNSNAVSSNTAEISKQFQLNKLRQAVLVAEQQVAEEESLELLELQLLQDNEMIANSLKQCEEYTKHIAELSIKCQEHHQDLTRIQFFYDARKVKLLSELQSVYPIELSEEGVYAIRGIELPIDTNSKDDEQISSAIGYLVHLIILTSKYLDISLRYPLLFHASRSWIRDPITGTALPLYKRGQDREKFDNGFLWLQRDCQQLMASRNVAYDKTKCILGNVKKLFDCAICPAIGL